MKAFKRHDDGTILGEVHSGLVLSNCANRERVDRVFEITWSLNCSRADWRNFCCYIPNLE